MTQTSTKKTIATIISILLGVLMVVSAWSKTYPISSFEYTIYSQLGFSKDNSMLLARIMIGIEYALGIGLLVHFLLQKKWIVTANILLLVVFNVHLLIQLVTIGNDSNCGCMGDVVKMSPLASLGKNMIMLLLLIFVYRQTSKNPSVKVPSLLIILGAALVTGGIFLAFPLKANPSHLSYHTFFNADQPEPPQTSLLQGKHIVSFMTLGCSHCRDAAKDFVAIKKNNPDYPIYFVLMQPDDTTGLATKKQDFFSDTESEAIPHSFINQKSFVAFIEESNNSGTPVILWMQDSTIVREIPNGSIDQEDIRIWLKQNK